MKFNFKWFRRSIPRMLPRTGLVATCTILLGYAQAQIPNSENTQIPSGRYRIAGTVINAKGGSPLERARVTIADAKNQQSVQSVITNDNGRFELHVPAGKYSLGGAKRGFMAAGYNQHELFSTAIVTGADLDIENITLRLAPNALLTGKVLDEFGEPVRHAHVQVYRETHFQGVSRIVSGRAAVTDDQGRYEVTPLDEGTYYVSAKASPWYAVHPTSGVEGAPNSRSHVDSSLDVAYPITYYGDATEAEDAAPIPVRGGDRLEADIHLNPVPALHLIMHVLEDGTHRPTFPALQKPGFDGLDQAESYNVQYVAAGVYEMTGVAAGRYTVRIPGSGGTEVNLSSSGELDVSSGSPTSSIKATVGLAGAAALPSQLQIALRNSKGRVDVATEVDAKGEAHFSDIIAGKYEVVASSSTQRYSVVRIASEAGATSGHTLTVPPGASLTITLSLVGGSATVEGFAKQARKASSGVMVVLVPKNPEANHDRFRRDQSDLDGSFSLPNVIPGSYTIIAIENGWDLDWSEPAVLARYLKHGQSIEVGDPSQTQMRLADAVEVQKK
jgi:5-hydroxyisourate hydrolase-like protein (transthyretin family)